MRINTVLCWSFCSYFMLTFYWQDLSNEDNHNLEQVPIDEILEMQRDEQILKQEEEEKKKKALIERGLQPHSDYHEDLY